MNLICVWKNLFIICLFATTVISLPVVERSYSKSDASVQSDTQNNEKKKPKSLTISIQRPEPIHESFNDKLTDDEAEVLLPKAMKRRMGRFLFDLLDGSDASSMSSYMTDGSDDFFSGLGRLFNLNVDQNAVMTGVLAPENIAIHVAQNFVNFASSSMAWLALGMLTSRTHISRNANEPSTFEIPDDYTAYGTTVLPSYGSASSSKVRSSDGTSPENSFMSKTDKSNPSPENIIYVSEPEMNSINQAEMERERLYELQVQEYRRRKKLEQLRSQQQETTASEQVEVISDRRDGKVPFRLHPTEVTLEEQAQKDANQKELDKRLLKIESYKKYLAQQRTEGKNVGSPAYAPDNTKQVQPETLVKKRGPIITTKGGNVVRRVRKIIKKSSSS